MNVRDRLAFLTSRGFIKNSHCLLLCATDKVLSPFLIQNSQFFTNFESLQRKSNFDQFMLDRQMYAETQHPNLISVVAAFEYLHAIISLISWFDRKFSLFASLLTNKVLSVFDAKFPCSNLQNY